ncbi:substrate-binding periplasmic protein [Duganella flavida]|nr:ABC transporter substrate-binding protein [Duganella flavida]
MAFGDNLPPYILATSDAGIEVEIVRAALAYRGHVLHARYQPMGRIPVSFISGEVNAIMMDVGVDMAPHGGFYGKPPVLYDNVFYTLKSRNLIISKPDDLKGHSIMAFIGAAKRYPVWLAALNHVPGYVERNNQAVQPALLTLGRYEVILSDRLIFQYYTQLYQRANPGFVMPPLDEHTFTHANPRDYRPVFRDATVRDDFNAGLVHLHKTGLDRAIQDRYLKN